MLLEAEGETQKWMNFKEALKVGGQRGGDGRLWIADRQTKACRCRKAQCLQGYVGWGEGRGEFGGGMGWNLNAYLSISWEEGIDREGSYKRRLLREAVQLSCLEYGLWRQPFQIAILAPPLLLYDLGKLSYILSVFSSINQG